MKKTIITLVSLLIAAGVVYLTLSNELDRSKQIDYSENVSRNIISHISSQQPPQQVVSRQESSEVSSKQESKPTTVNSLVGVHSEDLDFAEDTFAADSSEALSSAASSEESSSTAVSSADDGRKQLFLNKADTLLKQLATYEKRELVSAENTQIAYEKQEKNRFYKGYDEKGRILIYRVYIYNQNNTKCYLDEYRYYYQDEKLLCRTYRFKEDYTKDRSRWADSVRKYFDERGLVELKYSRYTKENLLKLTAYDYDAEGGIVAKYVYGFNIVEQNQKESYTLDYIHVYDKNNSLTEKHRYA